MSWISRLNGVIWNIRHSSSCIHSPTVRCPSSVFFVNRFRSADCQKIQLPLGGSRGEEAIRFYHIIQPLSSVTFGRMLSAPTVRVGKLLPFSEQLSCVHFGRLRASPTGLRSFRFSLCTLPGGFGNQRVGTIPVRHCPAALPPAPTDGFYHATNRAVLSAAGICSRLYSLKMFCRLSTPVRIIDSPS